MYGIYILGGIEKSNFFTTIGSIIILLGYQEKSGQIKIFVLNMNSFKKDVKFVDRKIYLQIPFSSIDNIFSYDTGMCEKRLRN